MSSIAQNLTRSDLATRWGVHLITIKRWEKAGRLSPKRLGPRTIRYPLAYIEQLEADGIPS
ncbi:MAG: MerR family transcriptional regulator [Verrucomicrobiae bacterium]|nr:MerR family transcriptional regulator [Verrucomicrobiae bacterium]